MKKAALAIIVCLLIPSFAFSATVHLKNGGMISNVTEYYEKDGKYFLTIMGGTVEIPSADVVNVTGPVEEFKPGTAPMAPPPAAKPSPPPVPAKPPVKEKGMMEDFERMKARVAEIDAKIAVIEKFESEATAEKTEYDRTRLVIERIFQKGRTEALKNGKPESQWMSFLSAQEREWLQVNTLRKKEIEARLPSYDPQLKSFAEDKKVLLEEKAGLEEKLEWYYH